MSGAVPFEGSIVGSGRRQGQAIAMGVIGESGGETARAAAAVDVSIAARGRAGPSRSAHARCTGAGEAGYGP